MALVQEFVIACVHCQQDFILTELEESRTARTSHHGPHRGKVLPSRHILDCENVWRHIKGQLYYGSLSYPTVVTILNKWGKSTRHQRQGGSEGTEMGTGYRKCGT